MKKLWNPVWDDERKEIVLQITDIEYDVEQANVSVTPDDFCVVNFTIAFRVPHDAVVTLGPREFLIDGIDALGNVTGHEMQVGFPEMPDPIYNNEAVGGFWFNDALGNPIGPYSTEEEAFAVWKMMMRTKKEK